MMKISASLLIATVGLAPAFALAAPIVRWDFNTDDGDGTTGTTLPSLGSGALSLVGGTLDGFTFGTGSGDPAPSPLNSAWTVRNLPPQGTLSGTAGLQGATSTVGMGDLTVSWVAKNQPSANKWFSLQYRTISGESFTEAAAFGIPASNAWTPYSFAIADPAAANNPDFAFRIVATFAPGTTAYAATEAGYNRDFGTDYDLLTVSGTPVPEPASFAALAFGALALARRKRRGPPRA